MKVFWKTWYLILFICAESTLSMSQEYFDCKFQHQKSEKILLLKLLKNEKNINLSHNQIQNLEELVLKLLENEKNINLSHNRIQNLEKLFTLKNLTMLDVSHNLIVNILKEIKELKNLVQLNLSHNIIFEIPTEIGMLENLILLNLSYNQLRDIPSSLGKLLNLKQLDLSHNFIKNLPKELWKLKNLKFLGLSENRLEGLSNSIEKLINLKILTLDNNEKLLSLPPGLENLKSLEEIYIDKKFSMKKFLNKNDQNPKILNLNNKKLPCIPIDIIMLKENLEELYLKNNNFTKIPSFLDKLKKLKKLDLSKNQINSIEDVPDEIFELPNLETLIFSVKQEKIPPIEISKNEEGRWIVKYKNKKYRKLKKAIGVEKNGNLIIEYSRKGIEKIRQKRIDKLKSKISDILINYLFVYNNKTQLSDKFLREQVTKDQDSLSRLYKKENKLRIASDRFRSDKIKANHHKIDLSETNDLSRLNVSRSIRNGRHDDFAQ